jgi:GTP-binding protein
VDLPGFGFAKISKKLQQAWHKELNNYLKKRDALKAVFIIVDIRRDLTSDDEDIIKMTTEYNLLPVIILNKADKISKSAAKTQLMRHQKHYNNEVPCFIFSATKKQGLDAVLTKFYHILVD